MALESPPAGLEGWFAAGCRDVFALAAVRDFEPFATVLEAALEQVLTEQGLDASAHDRHAAAKAGVDPKELALAAVHPRDIHGAAAAGSTTAYLEADRPYPSVMTKSDRTGRTLPDLAQKIADLYGRTASEVLAWAESTDHLRRDTFRNARDKASIE